VSAWSNASARPTSTRAQRRRRPPPARPDGKPKGGRYKREFGVPEDKAQENFTDPDSRIMKRAGGGFDPATTPRPRWTRQRTSSWRPNC
jgi:hypothetical protein